ncbi:MAG: hypothetical protein RIF33_11670 [Cyclobacteriaceae bacterium]
MLGIIPNSRFNHEIKKVWKNVYWHLGEIIVTILLGGVFFLTVFITNFNNEIKFILYPVIFALLYYAVFSWRDFIREYLGKVISSLVILYIVAFSSMTLTQFNSVDESTPTTDIIDFDKLKELLHFKPNFQSPGSAFTLFLSVITVFGFTLTILKLQEKNLKISTYGRFLERQKVFYNQCLNTVKVGNKKIWVKVMTTSPTLGNVINQDYYAYDLHRTLRKFIESEKIEIEAICMGFENTSSTDILPTIKDGYHDYSDSRFANQSENQKREEFLEGQSLSVFYKGFKNKVNDDTLILKATLQAYEIFKFLENKNQGNKAPITYGHLEKGPHFHLFLSEKTAIVAMPLDRDLSYSRKVDLIGYETSDPNVIESLEDTFHQWKNEILENK